jgi:hypothetical protein
VKFARIAFAGAAVYGFAVLLPLYFLLGRVNHDTPPAITHEELYYGFIGLAVLWQAVFVLIATDPVRYRPIMLIAILEKVIYTIPVVILYMQGRVHPKTLAPALVDPVLGLLFLIAYLRTREAR